jgi:hypothetical protein
MGVAVIFVTTSSLGASMKEMGDGGLMQCNIEIVR